uniref:C-type lectin domain-containing protein n=1 Tax=Oreochromis aureus TaxID=47969 RepID=A0AAZ1XBM7_OREAU
MHSFKPYVFHRVLRQLQVDFNEASHGRFRVLSGRLWNTRKHKIISHATVVTEEKKAWEEAVEYCREHHNDLASVASETEMMLIQKELKKHNTTEHVWIGLRFLSRDWLWVDGEELDYEAWVEGGKPLCPHPKMNNNLMKSNMP